MNNDIIHLDQNRIFRHLYVPECTCPYSHLPPQKEPDEQSLERCMNSLNMLGVSTLLVICDDLTIIFFKAQVVEWQHQPSTFKWPASKLQPKALGESNQEHLLKYCNKE